LFFFAKPDGSEALLDSNTEQWGVSRAVWIFYGILFTSLPS